MIFNYILELIISIICGYVFFIYILISEFKDGFRHQIGSNLYFKHVEVQIFQYLKNLSRKK